MRKETVICIVLTVISFIVCVAGYMILPDTVTIQIGPDGQPSSTAPKMLGVALPLVITLIGTAGSLLKKDKKFIAVSAIGTAAGIFMILINR